MKPFLLGSRQTRISSYPLDPNFKSRGFGLVNKFTASMGADQLTARVPHVLTVAGSDSGGGAGIQADLKACGARGVYCSTVITALTAQNTAGVQVKTGMLPSIGIIKVLLRNLKEYPVQAFVVDPVLVSTSGDILAGPSVLDCFREELFPVADIITPNIKEASTLLGGMEVKTISDMRSAAKLIHAMGPRNVLIKGGDLPASMDAIDILFDGNEFFEFHSERIHTQNTHGTGCTMASCIAAELAKGSSMLPAVKVAKHFVEAALHYSKDMTIGKGSQGPFDHFMKLKISSQPIPFDPNQLFLYAVTDSRMNKKWGRSMTDAVKEAIEGGATIIQLREKESETKDFVEAAYKCLEICHEFGVPLLINDRVDVALACNADGVHVGQSDMPARVARSLLGPDKIIGVSCKTPEQALQAWADGADYIGCGGVYPTMTKANNITVGLDGLKNVCSASKLPVVAIGGISHANTCSVMEIGCSNLKGVAVVSALFDQECVMSETRNLHSELRKHICRG
uniref:thiamine phosphate synthase n=1 Tax=Kalanchoe fedtschenkoi TaxID=63787 RepID=A0A7N0UHX1_KALFE